MPSLCSFDSLCSSTQTYFYLLPIPILLLKSGSCYSQIYCMHLCLFLSTISFSFSPRIVFPGIGCSILKKLAALPCGKIMRPTLSIYNIEENCEQKWHVPFPNTSFNKNNCLVPIWSFSLYLPDKLLHLPGSWHKYVKQNTTDPQWTCPENKKSIFGVVNP